MCGLIFTADRSEVHDTWVELNVKPLAELQENTAP